MMSRATIPAQRLLNPQERRFAWLFFVTLIFAFSPSKVLGQFIGLFFLVGMIFYVQLRPIQHIIVYTIISFAYIVLGCLYYVVLPEFSFINQALFFVTASSGLILFYSFRPLMSAPLLRQLARITAWVLVFESLWGIAQAVYGAITSGSFDVGNGDQVAGTLQPFPGTLALGSNPMYAILISSLLLFHIATVRRHFAPQRLAIYGLTLSAWLLASVLHTILFFGIATVLANLPFIRPRGRPKRNIGQKSQFWSRRNAFILGGVVIFMVVLVPAILPSNLLTLPNFIRYNINISPTAESEKPIATYHTLFSLPEDIPIQPLIGLGPGQYSSRASMIRSGEYLTGTRLPLPAYTNEIADTYILNLWRTFLRVHPDGGSSYFPFYSWLSLYGEFGAIGLMVVGLTVLWMLHIFRRLYSVEFPYMSMAALVFLFYMLLLGIQDNYWEFTQAIFPGVLTFALYLSYLRKETAERQRAENPLTSGPISLPQTDART